jgi:endonuclease/exonuclease/phosphatase family metal-dependent hydrolase
MFSAFDPNVSYGGASQYGTAILSKYPITSTSNVDLPRPGATQQRGLARAVIDVDGKEVAIYNTHLQNLSESARIQQINRIVQIASLDPLPQIFGGDMNAHYGSPVMGIARRHYIDTWDVVGTGDGRTHPATNLRGRIDYLMHANAGITAITSDVLAPVQSDHKAVRATYTVEGEGGRDCVLEKPEF